MDFLESQFSLKDKIAVVTGGGGVLGGSMAIALAQAGARVGLLGRRLEPIEKNAHEIIALGGEAIALPADVLDKEQLIAARGKIEAKFGNVNILVNAAGGNQPNATVAPDQSIFDLDIEAMKNVVELNLLGTVLPTQIFVNNMAVEKSGVIINISSIAGISPLTRVGGYSSAKAAIENYTKWLSVELTTKYGEGLRVNAIAPGFFIGEQNRDLLINENGSMTDRGKTIISNTPMGRFGNKNELQGTLIWLCSDASKFVTGISVPVDGGFSAFCGV